MAMDVNDIKQTTTMLVSFSLSSSQIKIIDTSTDLPNPNFVNKLQRDGL